MPLVRVGCPLSCSFRHEWVCIAAKNSSNDPPGVPPARYSPFATFQRTRAPIRSFHCSALPERRLGYAHISSAVCFRRLLPSPPACGGRERGPRRKAWEGEVVVPPIGACGSPHLTPTLSVPKGGEGDIWARGVCMRARAPLNQQH
jgi:hypothetical protein